MAKHTFAKVMPRVFKSEGGYVDHPRDPGGATNYGITRDTLADWRGRVVTKAEVKVLTKDEASEIYYNRYWLTVSGDELPAGVDYAVFDFGINSGPSRAVKYLQRVVSVPQDGKIGPITLQAVRAQGNPNHIINALCDARLAFMKGLKAWPTFGKGWARRVSKVRSIALELAASDLPQFRQPDDPGVTEPLEPPQRQHWLGPLIGALVAAGAAVAGYLGLR